MVRDIHDVALSNKIDYTNIKCIKVALATIHTLIDKANKGNYTACVIVLDINDAISKLPVIEQQCINKYYFEGYTQMEIASQLNVSQRLVSGHITSAIINIMNILN